MRGNQEERRKIEQEEREKEGGAPDQILNHTSLTTSTLLGPLNSSAEELAKKTDRELRVRDKADHKTINCN
jgi:hypothetical protein